MNRDLDGGEIITIGIMIGWLDENKLRFEEETDTKIADLTKIIDKLFMN